MNDSQGVDSAIDGELAPQATSDIVVDMQGHRARWHVVQQVFDTRSHVMVLRIAACSQPALTMPSVHDVKWAPAPGAMRGTEAVDPVRSPCGTDFALQSQAVLHQYEAGPAIHQMLDAGQSRLEVH